MKRDKELKLVVRVDGAKDNWTFLETFHPEVSVLDFWHAARHLEATADADFGPDRAEGIAWIENCTTSIAMIQMG